MNYKIFKKLHRSTFALCLLFLGLISCYDSGYDEFIPPTGNVNNIQPNTLFTTSTSADDTMSFVFRSYSTDATSYLWDFGDGNTSTEANPNYTYATGGEYTVTLTTTSSGGLVAEDSSVVAPIFIDFNFTMVDSEVFFENITSGASSLVWDFGDGEETIEWLAEDTEDDPDFSPVHVYKTAETFVATLTATNFLGGSVSVSKNIEGLVLSTVPDFTFAVSGFTVNFTDASILAVSYSWDFGDGSGETSTEPSPSHVFPGEGTYDVTLTTTNDAGVSKSNTQVVVIGAIEATFAAVILNGDAEGGASDWDMKTYGNSALDDWLLTNTGDKDQQPGSTGDGNWANGAKTKGLKLYEIGRRIYQPITVEVGVQYTITMESRSEVVGVPTEVYILNTEITSEDNIQDYADAFFEITNDYNKDKSNATDNNFTTSTFTFVATTTTALIYMRAPNALDSSTEVFVDNISIMTPGFDENGNSSTVEATFEAVVLNGDTEAGADTWNLSKYGNSALDDWLLANTGDKNQQPGSTGDGNWANGVKTKGLKLYGIGRRIYQPVTVEVGVEYTFTMESRSEAVGVPTEVYILNTEITSEDNIQDYADAFIEITNDYNKDKSNATDNNFTTTTFTFIPTTTTALIYMRAPNALDSSTEVFVDNISIMTPGF